MATDRPATPDDLRRYVALLERGDRAGAVRLAVALMEEGMHLGDVVLGLLAPAQAEVGRRWQDGRWSVAQEAAATEIADTVLAVAAGRSEPAPRRGALVLCLAEREHHNLPARMVAELLRADGFAVTFLGAPRDGRLLAGLLAREEVDALVLSCSIACNLPGVEPLLATAHEAGTPVLVGGHALGADDLRARRLGADGWAPTIRDAGALLDRWRAAPPALALPERDHDQHAELRAIRRPLVREVVEDVRVRHGSLLRYDLRVARRLVEDTDNLVRFLEAAVLCDERIFAEYAAWLGERLRGQGDDPRLLPAVLDGLARRVGPDFPAAAYAIGLARDDLRAAA